MKFSGLPWTPKLRPVGGVQASQILQEVPTGLSSQTVKEELAGTILGLLNLHQTLFWGHKQWLLSWEGLFPEKNGIIAKIVFTIIIVTIMPVHSALSAYKALA